MKKASTFVITILLGASLALAQTGGDKQQLNPQPLPPGKKAQTTETSTKGKKAHKGGKKSKKGSSTSPTPPPN
jgi:hypothetical protein